FRVLGGMVGIAIASSVSTPYIRSHLASAIPKDIVSVVLDKTRVAETFSLDTSTQAQKIFGESYNLQIKILIIFTITKLPVTAIT
ncbi:hypothetical protein BS50DRAFT_490473, partial [Corynespora cassiicola Philippines]